MIQKLLLLLAVLSCARGECGQKYCPRDTTHAGCIKPLTFSESCGPADKLFVKVAGTLREEILLQVNLLRNQVASGFFNTSAAARMPVMSWDKELAKLANVLILMCDQENQLCSNTEKYRYVATVKLNGTSKNYHHLVDDLTGVILPNWLAEALACSMDETHHLKHKKKNKCEGNYIPLLQDRGDRMGCAVRLIKPVNTKVRPSVTMICNLSRANINDEPPYLVGQVAGEACEAGTHDHFKYLCDHEEVVDANYVAPTPSHTPCDKETVNERN